MSSVSPEGMAEIIKRRKSLLGEIETALFNAYIPVLEYRPILGKIEELLSQEVIVSGIGRIPGEGRAD